MPDRTHRGDDRLSCDGLHVGFFTDSYDLYEDYVDGVAVIAGQFTKYATARELALTIFTNSSGDSTERVSDTVTVHRFKPVIPWYLPRYHEMPLELVVPNPRLAAILEQTSLDVIHFTQPSTMGANALYAAGRPLPCFPLTVPAIFANVDIRFLRRSRGRLIPLIGSFHTNLPAFVRCRTGSGFLEERFKEVLNWFYRQCDLILATSGRTQTEIRRYIKGKAFGLLRPAVDAEAFHPAKRSTEFRNSLRANTILLFAGRVEPEKNISFLKDTYLALRRSQPDIHLFVAGDGTLSVWLKEQLGQHVTIGGFLYGDDLCRAFASSDILLFPSTTDTLGLVVMEAQASGLPVIVMDQGGPKEVVEEGKTGFVCSADTIADFVGNTERLIANPGLRAQMARAARGYAESFSWNSAFDDLLQTYGRVVSVSEKTAQS